MANNPFKLNNPYKNDSDNEPRKPRFSIFYYITVILLIIGFQLAFFWSGSTREIAYSEFRQMIANNKVEAVRLSPEKIFVQLKADPVSAASKPPAGQQPQSFRMPGREPSSKEVTVNPVRDEQLIPLLESKASVTKRRPETHGSVNFCNGYCHSPCS